MVPRVSFLSYPGALDVDKMVPKSVMYMQSTDFFSLLKKRTVVSVETFVSCRVLGKGSPNTGRGFPSTDRIRRSRWCVQGMS